MDDGTDIMDLFTRTNASFAAEKLPTDKKSVTGIVSEFTTGATPGYQLNIRSTADIK
jgi:hypothetical protein